MKALNQVFQQRWNMDAFIQAWNGSMSQITSQHSHDYSAFIREIDASAMQLAVYITMFYRLMHLLPFKINHQKTCFGKNSRWFCFWGVWGNDTQQKRAEHDIQMNSNNMPSIFKKAFKSQF